MQGRPEVLKEVIGRNATHLSPAEIGGINSLVPFINAVYVSLPVIDGDGEGRAFPRVPDDNIQRLRRGLALCAFLMKRETK